MTWATSRLCTCVRPRTVCLTSSQCPTLVWAWWPQAGRRPTGLLRTHVRSRRSQCYRCRWKDKHIWFSWIKKSGRLLNRSAHHFMSLYVGFWVDWTVASEEYVSAYEPCVLFEFMRSSNDVLSPIESFFHWHRQIIYIFQRECLKISIDFLNWITQCRCICNMIK